MTRATPIAAVDDTRRICTQNGKIETLELINLSKSFPGVDALKGFSATFRAGEVIGLVGENGAGKSTLIKVLSGVFRPSSGHFSINGQATEFSAPYEAEQAGIRTIYQELILCQHLTVAENILLGTEPRMGGLLKPFFIDQAALRDRAAELLREINVELPLDAPIAELTIAQQQMTEIAKALAGDAAFLIMDEPTSSLSKHEIEHLLELIQSLKAQGRLILFVSHRIDEVLAVTDRIVVLRDGELVGEIATAEATHDQIIQMMVGRNLDFKSEIQSVDENERAVLEVRDLVVPPDQPPVSFDLRPGEILCLAGLVGAGRSEILHAIFQSRPGPSGQVVLDDAPLRGVHPSDAIKQGLGFVPEDRKLQGIILSMTVSDNLTLPALGQLTDVGLINFQRERSLVSDLVKRYLIRTPSSEVPVRNLSGGNQQKVVLAKWLSLHPKVLLIDEPTRGVDVGGKAEIYRLLRNMADVGVGILMVSSEIEEVLRIATRVLVVAQGRITKQLAGEQITEQAILQAAFVQGA